MAHQSVMAAARTAILAVHVPAPVSVAMPSSPGGRIKDENPLWMERATVEAKRFGIALICGLVVYAVTAGLLAVILNRALPGVAVRTFVAAALEFAALGVGLILGYAFARRLIRRPIATPADPLVRPPADVGGAPGWKQFETAIIAWFVGLIDEAQARPASVSEECINLAEQLELGESLIEEIRVEAARSKPVEQNA